MELSRYALRQCVLVLCFAVQNYELASKSPNLFELFHLATLVFACELKITYLCNRKAKTDVKRLWYPNLSMHENSHRLYGI